MQITSIFLTTLPDAPTRAERRSKRSRLKATGLRSSRIIRASQLLGMSRFEFERSLKNRQVYDHAYDAEGFEQDLVALQQFEAMTNPPRP